MPATEEQKQAIMRQFVQAVHVSANQTAQVDSDDLLAAAEDAYNWAEANQGAYNSALATPFKTVATVKQKAWLLGFAIEELVKAS